MPGVQSRDHRLDRAKGVLIFLVVLGHVMAAVSPWESDTLRVLQTVIYSFHMPAFVFLAGVTAKSQHLADRIGVLLVLLFTALPLYYWWMDFLGLEPDFDFLVPYWITWFLLAMVWWMLSVPLIERAPRVMVGVSIAAALLGGLIPVYDYELAIARTLSFWPFFVIGKVYGTRILAWVGARPTTQRLGLSAAAAVPIAVFYAFDVDKLWFYGVRGFDWLDVSVAEGLGMRTVIGLSAALSTLALLSWISGREGYLATIGRRSLAIYLLHGFAIRLLNLVLHDSLDTFPAAVMLVICVGLAAAITAVFSLRVFDRGIRAYSETITTLILRPFARFRTAPR